MKRRELFRRTFYASVWVTSAGSSRALGSAREFPEDYDASKELARPDWKPKFLSTHQHNTLELLGDLIIPEDDTPGAKNAFASRFIDHLLANEKPSVQEAFLRSLFFIDGESLKRYGNAFLFLDRATQTELLTYLAYPHRHSNWGDTPSSHVAFGHFQRIKNAISRAFYTSEIGMKELGWDESPFHNPFQGCEHPPGTHAQ
jgi:hypothetical protein